MLLGELILPFFCAYLLACDILELYYYWVTFIISKRFYSSSNVHHDGRFIDKLLMVIFIGEGMFAIETGVFRAMAA